MVVYYVIVLPITEIFMDLVPSYSLLGNLAGWQRWYLLTHPGTTNFCPFATGGPS
jgi:hypothetical protein